MFNLEDYIKECQRQLWEESVWIIYNIPVLQNSKMAKILKQNYDMLNDFLDKKIREGIEKAKKEAFTEAIKKIEKMAITNADSGYYDKAMFDVLSILSD